MRYFITLSFDGARYHGWQIQPNGPSIQEKLQWALSTLLREDIQVTGAGRTDAGVHARMMVAHFDFSGEWEGQRQMLDCIQLAYKLNRLLPQDIAVQKVEPVSNDMHARFSAIARTYHYYIHTVKDPFLRTTSCELHYPLDFDKMNEAAALLLTYYDFGAFCKAHADVPPTASCATWYVLLWEHSSMWDEAGSPSMISVRWSRVSVAQRPASLCPPMLYFWRMCSIKSKYRYTVITLLRYIVIT